MSGDSHFCRRLARRDDHAPFTANQDGITVEGRDTAGEPITLTLNPAMPFGSLQTVFDGQRSMLIATSNGAPAQLDELLRWLSAKKERWFALDGREVISFPGSEPVAFPILPPTSRHNQKPSNARHGYKWVWWVAAGSVAAAAVGALVILLRARRRRAPLSRG